MRTLLNTLIIWAFDPKREDDMHFHIRDAATQIRKEAIEDVATILSDNMEEFEQIKKKLQEGLWINECD